MPARPETPLRPRPVPRSGPPWPFLAAATALIWGSQHAGAQVRITLAAIPEAIPAVRPDGSLNPNERPGFRVEVLRAAGKTCGTTVNFMPVPWQRALELVKSSSVDGAFSASWSEERATFGAFPMRNGVPDPAKAMRGYTYNLYVHPASRLGWDGKALTAPTGSSRKVIVERGSAGVDLAARLGLEPVQVSGYANMVRMLAERRADGLVGIDVNVERQLAESPQLTPQVKEVTPPLETRHGYVMFSKTFYAGQPALSECMWKALADIRSKPAYRELVKSYQNGEFSE